MNYLITEDKLSSAIFKVIDNFFDDELICKEGRSVTYVYGTKQSFEDDGYGYIGWDNNNGGTLWIFKVLVTYLQEFINFTEDKCKEIIGKWYIEKYHNPINRIYYYSTMNLLFVDK